MTLREIEKQAIEQAMRRHDNNKTAVAKELGICLKTLYNKLNAYRLGIPQVSNEQLKQLARQSNIPQEWYEQEEDCPF